MKQEINCFIFHACMTVDAGSLMLNFTTHFHFLYMEKFKLKCNYALNPKFVV